MKLLHREDVLEAGYDLPNTGLCANIGTEEMQELKFGGEWILAEDEVLVADGHEQRYLYMVVSGEVAITKVGDNGKTQQIASLGLGAAFGEMAFLTGGVASANVQAVGEVILWRLDHERLLEFIGDHGFAGGQLCLNVASILSGRLIDGNKKVVDMGKELQNSLAQLQHASSAGSQKDQALRQMQGKVANMQNAFKGGAVKKGGNLFAMAASVVAFISTAGMIALFLADDDTALQEAASVISKVKKLEANEDFYLGLKKRLEDENKELVDREKDVNKEKEELANNLSDAMSETQDLRMQLKKVEDELSEAKDDLVRAQKVTPAQSISEPTNEKQELAETTQDKIMQWARNNSTMAFPVLLQVKETPVTLQDRGGNVKIPVSVGKSVKALKFHPSSADFLIVAQENSDKFLASMRLSNSSFIESVAPKYARHQQFLGESLPKGLKELTGVNTSPKPETAEKTISEVAAQEESVEPAEISIAVGKARNPQKPENLLDNMPKPKVDTSDHGSNCVCKDCRVKKIGKGSLFPDL